MLPTVLLLSLAAAPAKAPPRPYDVQHYRVDMRLSNDGAFDNQAAITLAPSRTVGSIELDSYGLDVQKVTLDGEDVPFTLEDVPARRTGTLTLRPKKALAAKKPVTFHIHYKGRAGTEHVGLFQVRDTQDESLLPYFFTQFESEYARRFVPSNDRPDDKATTELFAIVDAKYTVLSNGKKLKDETFSEAGHHLRRVHWKQETPHPLYAMAVAVGQFEPVEVRSSVKSTLWIAPGRKDRAYVATDATTSALSFLQSYLGVKYPWAKYDQVAVPRFVWGGMENTSLVLMRENGLLLEDRNHVAGRTRITGLIAHELAHQWFGDLVTCESWSDIWLNEGFATFLAWKAEDAYYDTDMVEVGRASRVFVGYFREEDGPRSRPLVDRSGRTDVFDSTAYDKGAHVLRMLEHWVGEEKFKAGIKAYLEKYAHKNASSEDFFATFMKATGTERELRGFRDAWLHKAGYPVVTVDANWNGVELKVTVRQKPNHAHEKGHFVFKLPVVFHRDGTPSYHEEAEILVDKPVVTASFDLPAAPKWVNWNRDGVALVKIHAPAISEQEWIAAARNDPDPVWRTLAAYVLLGELVNPEAREQKSPSAAAMDAIVHVLTKDSSPYVREAVLHRLADSPWKRLPETLGPVLLDLSRRPKDLAEDALGVVRVRRAAMAALGKIDFKEGKAYLYEQVMRPDIDLNYLPGASEGTANVGDPEALATLGAAMRIAKGRGYAFYKAAATGLGAVTTPEAVPAIESFVKENAGNSELMTLLVYQLHDNRIVKSSPEFAAFVQRFVLGSEDHGDDIKQKFLRLLDEVKTKDAKDALAAIAEKSDSAHLQDSARRVLERNFPGQVMPASAKSTKKVKGRN